MIEPNGKIVITVLYIVTLMMSLIFYVLSSSLILGGGLTDFEIMVSGIIFFSMLFLSTYTLFTKINLNIYVHFGAVLVWAQMLFYNLGLDMLQKIGFIFIGFGLFIEVLDMFGVKLCLKVKYKSSNKRRNSKRKRKVDKNG